MVSTPLIWIKLVAGFGYTEKESVFTELTAKTLSTITLSISIGLASAVLPSSSASSPVAATPSGPTASSNPSGPNSEPNLRVNVLSPVHSAFPLKSKVYVLKSESLTVIVLGVTEFVPSAFVNNKDKTSFLGEVFLRVICICLWSVAFTWWDFCSNFENLFFLWCKS